VFVLGRPIQPLVMFVSKASSLTKSGGAKLGLATALPAKIRLDMKSLPGTHILAHLEN